MSGADSADHVCLLGTKGGPAIRPGSSMPSANLLVLDGRVSVIDCGLGVSKALVDQGLPLAQLSQVFITHLHADHYLELGPLLHTAWTVGLQREVTVYGPAGLAAYWQHFTASMAADIAVRIDNEGRPDLRELVSVQVIEAGEFRARDGLRVAAMRTEHPPLRECFALRFSGRHHRVVFSGDTAPMAALADFARGVDLLVHEAMLESALPALLARVGNGSDKLMRHWRRAHSPASEAARIAQRAAVKALALSHLIPADDPGYSEAHWRAACREHWDGLLYVGRDGMRIPLAEGEKSCREP